MINRYYVCSNCNYSFMIQQNMHDKLKKKCPTCGAYALYQDLTGQHTFVYQSPTTLGHLAEKNTKKMGTYELEKREYEKNKGEMGKRTAPWYNTDNVSLPNELKDLDTVEKKQKYIMKGEE